MKTEIIKADGSRISVRPENGRDFQLDELQAIVGGYIQIISLHDGRLMVINEEGKLQALPYNNDATELAQEAEAIFDYDFIVGDALVCREEEVR